MNPITREEAFLEYQISKLIKEIQDLKKTIKNVEVKPPVEVEAVPVRRKKA